jgi:N-terminal domain of toast_rack, DUF2154/LiaI-LiaF-like transmembrane region
MGQSSENRPEVARVGEGAITGPLTTEESGGAKTQYVPPELRPYGGNQYPGGEATPPQYAPPQPAPSAPTTEAARQPHRPPLVGPILLIGAGLIFLLNNLGILDWGIWGSLWQLWPLVLVAIGLDLLIGRRNRMLSLLLTLGVLAAGLAFLYAGGGFQPAGNVVSVPLSEPLPDVSSAEVFIDLGIGTLTVDGSEETLLASGNLEYYENRNAPQVETARRGDSVNLTIRQDNRDGPGFNFLRPNQGIDWEVHLNNKVPMKLNVDNGTGQMDLDLSDLKLSQLTVDSGTGAVDVTMPANAGATSAEIDGGTGSITVTIPESVEARVEVDSGIGNVDVDSRFEKRGDVYVSNGYDTATNKLDLNVHVGTGNVEVR